MEEKQKRLKLYLIAFLGLIIVGILVKTSITKLINIDYYAYAVRKYPFSINSTVSFYLVIIIATIEILTACSFFFMSLQKSFFVTFILYLAFIVSLLSLVFENEVLDCGCGLFYKTLNPKFMLLVDVGISIIIFISFSYLRNISNEENLFTLIINSVKKVQH